MVANRTDADSANPKITKTKAIITGEFSRSSQTMDDGDVANEKQQVLTRNKAGISFVMRSGPQHCTRHRSWLSARMRADVLSGCFKSGQIRT
jgi:hypothetical protein